MADVAGVRKQLKIKSGVVQRLAKEYGLYQKEAEEQKKKVEKFIADGAEEWDIKNGKKMLEESEKMIQDTRGRLEKAADELKDLIDRSKRVDELKQDEELLKAEEILKKSGF